MLSSVISFELLRFFQRFAHMSAVEWWMWVAFDDELDRFGPCAPGNFTREPKRQIDTCRYAGGSDNLARPHNSLIGFWFGAHDSKDAHLVQCVVAGNPFRIPAGPTINALVQTEAVDVVVSFTLRSQSITSSSAIWPGVVVPRGTSTRSGGGVSAIVWDAPDGSAPPSVVTGPVSFQTNRTSVSGMRESTSDSPTASGAVTPG